MAFVVSTILLIIFVANVTYGAITGSPVLGNVAEMLILFGASISFVFGILKREAEAERAKNE